MQRCIGYRARNLPDTLYLATRLSEMFPDDSVSLRLANATIPVAANIGRGQGRVNKNEVKFVLETR